MNHKDAGLLPQVTFAILFALSLKPRHGYELVQQIAQDSGDRMQLGPGTLYGTLKRLSADNLVEEIPFAGDNQRRRYYRLTRKGWNQLQPELEYYKRIARLAGERAQFGVFENS